MNALKYEIISRVEQDMSLVHFAHLWDILVNTRNKFHISARPCIILYLFIVLFEHSSTVQVVQTSFGFNFPDPDARTKICIFHIFFHNYMHGFIEYIY